MKLFGLFIFLSFLFSGCSDFSVIDFTPLKTNVQASLRGLFVVDENTVWASGSEGTVLLSTDGGENWKNVAVPGAEENDFRSIHAWDENNALVFGVAGPDFGYKTTNGGETWEVVFRDTTNGLFFNSLKFADETTGLAVSDAVNEKPFLIKTNDSGLSWKRILNIPDAVKGEANFAASNTCIEFLPTGQAWIATGGSKARVFYSSDFGESWKVADTPMVQGVPSSGIFSVCFMNDLNGVIVGGTYNQPELNQDIAAYTHDGGKAWTVSKAKPQEYRSCVQYMSDGKTGFLFAIGKTGCDVSADTGKTWNFLSEKGYYTFRPVPGRLQGFVAGGEGKAARIEMHMQN